jgi:hypothetical protein
VRHPAFLRVIRGSLPLLTVRAALAQTPAPNRITLLTLNQPPCATLQPTSVIRAKLVYNLAETEQSTDGFVIFIKFQRTNPRMTFSDERQGVVAISARQDTVTLTYPIAAIRHNAQLKRPLTCYFYLHRNTGPGRNVVIAQTAPVIFQECQ